MRDPNLDRLADVLVRYSTRVKPGDLVCINGDVAALPLVEACYEAVLRAGAHPFWSASSESLTDIFFDVADEKQLTFISPLELQRYERMDVYLALWAERNTRSLSTVDPKRTAMAKGARRQLMDLFMKRTAAGDLRWCGTLFPTEASAQDAGMSLRQYERFVFEAGLLHLPDPVAAWQQIHEKQERARSFLQGKKEVHFKVEPHDGHDGTDLRVSVDGSTWINCAGTENFPDGEVFAGPKGVEGHVNYSFPAVHNGREVTGVRLAFKGGRVVDASAKTNEAFLIEMLDMDAGARTLGEIAIGTNYQIQTCTRNTLFDEKVGGTFHAAVGAGYPESGNDNQSALHWDMVCDLRHDPATGSPGGTIAADGEVFHKNGRFTAAGMPGAD